MKAHSSYKESGVCWIGKVPTHWDILPARRAVRDMSDKNDGGRDQNYLSLVAGRGVIPYAEKGDMGNKKPDDLAKCKLVRRGNIVLNSMNFFIGAYGMSSFDGVCSPVYIVLDVLSQTMHPRFALRVFGVPGFQTYLATFGDGILKHRAAIGWDDIKVRYLPYPPLSEQTQIARFLDYETAKIDRLIEKQQQLIELLKEKRQAVISHAVTKGLNPDAPMKDSAVDWLGKVPAHWDEIPLKALFSLKHGYAFDGDAFSESGEFILMTPGNFHEHGGFRPKVPEKFYSRLDFPRDFILSSGQLLVAMTEQGPGLLGCALFVPDAAKYLHNQRLGLVCGVDRDRLSENFLYHVFNSARYRAEVSITATGVKVRHTSPSKMLSVKIFLPPLAEQVAIARFVDKQVQTIEAMGEKAVATVTLLQERRTALISAAVTGKIDVRGWTPPEGADGAEAVA